MLGGKNTGLISTHTQTLQQKNNLIHSSEFRSALPFCCVSDKFYGTPKPPVEPSSLLLNVTDQLLPGARPSSEGKRKRNKSVSNMEKASIEPPEEEEEEKPIVNGNGVAVTPGQHLTTSTEAKVPSALSRRPIWGPESRHKVMATASSKVVA